ncbi:hypothetical protein TNCV_366541 [Trichonephila clavipes]|nr:hypothetical protein TNCV_366541 [Trichonephila clavipes]
MWENTVIYCGTSLISRSQAPSTACCHLNGIPRWQPNGFKSSKCVAWRCPDGAQHLVCWPILAISGQLLASNGPVVESSDLNLVFGHAAATPNK